MTKRKKIVWLCVLAVCIVGAAAWLWPRSVGTVAGIPQDQVLGWTAVGWGEAFHLTVSAGEGEVTVSADPELPGELLSELYTFRFTRPIYDPGLTSQGNSWYHVLLVDGAGEQCYATLLSDGTLWSQKRRYALVGGQKEVDRLNRWFADVTREPVEQ